MEDCVVCKQLQCLIGLLHGGYRATHGGGVSVYISNLYQTKLITECTVVNDNIESCFVNLRRNNKNIVLGVVYRPTSGAYREFINKIEEFIDHCTNPNLEEFILCEDFNIYLLNFKNNWVSQQFLTFIQSYIFLPTITKPTQLQITHQLSLTIFLL